MAKITVNMSNLNTEERAQLLALVEKANAPKLWRPTAGEKYWFMYGDSAIGSKLWEGDKFDNGSFAIDNCFKTAAEAGFAVERLKVIHELRQFASEKNGKDAPYYLYTRAGYSTWSVYIGKVEQITAEMRFESENDAWKAIKAVGEQRIIKYYFGMEG